MGSTFEVPPPDWIIPETVLPHGDDPDCAMRDSAFALANGRFGCKGTRPGLPRGRQGTFVGGLLDDCASYAEDVGDASHRWVWPTGPNLWWTAFGRAEVPPGSVTRTLDMRTGSLVFGGEFGDGAGGRVRLRGRRFVSWADRALAAERLVLEHSGGQARGALAVTLGLDTRARSRKGRRHFDGWGRRAWRREGDVLVLESATRGSCRGLSVALACRAGGGEVSVSEEEGEPVMRVTGRGRLVVDRLVGLDSDVHGPGHAERALAACRGALQSGLDAEFRRHAEEMRRFWRSADVAIDGPLYERRATRFCVLAVGASTPDTSRHSFGAKLLAGEHYWGVVFWDADVFVVPYLTRVRPEAARRHIEFRHAGLPAARENARVNGFEGAQYPWNAGTDGSESSLGVYGEREIHVTAGVARAVADHVDWTGDADLFTSAGAEVLAGCADFWASRLEPDGGIRGVCGPDEWATDVPNNYYTNLMARRTLLDALRLCEGTAPADSLEAWRAAAERVIVPGPDSRGLIEQYEGFLALPEATPETAREGRDAGVQAAKQADVLMVPFVLPDELAPEAVRANLEYYAPRTAHRSSLSLAPHVVAAVIAGLRKEAHDYYVRAVSTDLRNRWATDDGGLHAAASAAAPLALMQGFAGMRRRGKRLAFSAALPEEWDSVEFRLRWRGATRTIHLTDGDTLEID